jgi:hypothetical protein
MPWTDLHKESERLAAEAEAARRAGDLQRALDLYLKAAEAETRALNALDVSKERTLAVTAVSAASLWFKAQQYSKAEQGALEALANLSLPPFAVNELRELLQLTWSESARSEANVRFAPGQVVVSVRGGEVVRGGAPLDLIIAKVQTVQSLFFRTLEFMRGLPHRQRGGPSRDIYEAFRPWLFQTAPGSYQFAVAVEERQQMELFQLPHPTTRDILALFLDVVRASVEDPESQLPKIIPDLEYQGTFLKLTRNLVPSGTVSEETEVRATTDPRPITLVPAVRGTIRNALRRIAPPRRAIDEVSTESLRGILRAVHLDRDWLEVAVSGQHIKVESVGETVDDVIGPMMNRPVIVTVARDIGGRYLFRDIESEG